MPRLLQDYRSQYPKERIVRVVNHTGFYEYGISPSPVPPWGAMEIVEQTPTDITVRKPHHNFLPPHRVAFNGPVELHPISSTAGGFPTNYDFGTGHVETPAHALVELDPPFDFLNAQNNIKGKRAWTRRDSWRLFCDIGHRWGALTDSEHQIDQSPTGFVVADWANWPEWQSSLDVKPFLVIADPGSPPPITEYANQGLARSPAIGPEAMLQGDEWPIIWKREPAGPNLGGVVGHDALPDTGWLYAAVNHAVHVELRVEVEFERSTTTSTLVTCELRTDFDDGAGAWPSTMPRVRTQMSGSETYASLSLTLCARLWGGSWLPVYGTGRNKVRFLASTSPVESSTLVYTRATLTATSISLLSRIGRDTHAIGTTSQ